MTQIHALRLGAVALIIPDYDIAIEFFNAIGFITTQDIDQGRKRWITMGSAGGSAEERAAGGSPCLVLARADTEEQRALIGRQGAGRVWLFLHTDDFERDAAKIIAAGGTFEEAPRMEPYGRVAVWRDIWGNRWDLIQPRAKEDDSA